MQIVDFVFVRFGGKYFHFTRFLGFPAFWCFKTCCLPRGGDDKGSTTQNSTLQPRLEIGLGLILVCLWQRDVNESSFDCPLHYARINKDDSCHSVLDEFLNSITRLELSSSMWFGISSKLLTWFRILLKCSLSAWKRKKYSRHNKDIRNYFILFNSFFPRVQGGQNHLPPSIVLNFVKEKKELLKL